MGMADTKRPPNYASIYFKLSYVCPRTWWFRKADFETVTLQTLLKRHKIEEIEADRNILLILVGQKQAPGQKGRHRHSSRVQLHKFLTNHTSIDCNCICGWLVSQGFWDTRISVCFSTHYIFFFWGGGGCSKGGWLVTQSTLPGSSSASPRTSTSVTAFCMNHLPRSLALGSSSFKRYRKTCMSRGVMRVTVNNCFYRQGNTEGKIICH